MIEAVRDEKGIYRSNFATLEKETEEQAPWLKRIRKGALSRFSDLGFPTTRQEEWRFTNVAPVSRISFRPGPGQREGLTRQELGKLPFADLGCPRAVFLNGHFSSRLSSLESLPPGVKVESISRLVKEDASRIQPHLAQYALYEAHGLIALNTAFISDGAFIWIAPGVILEQPIQVLFLSFSDRQPTISHPRLLVLAEANSEACLVESYLGLGESTRFTNPVAEIILGENAVLDHYKVQLEGKDTFHIGALQAHQARNSTLTTHSVTLGGDIIRNEINVVLDGEGAESTLNGLFLAKSEQHVDNHTQLNHTQPHCSSRELYKGILAGKSRGVFHGRIHVYKGAQRTDAKQTNNNLLLSDQALIQTKPQLEIYADDVKCTHGATIGQLDKDSLFYLRSRGMSEEVARNLLIHAFASEVIERVRVGSLKTRLQEFLFEWIRPVVEEARS